MKNSRKIKGLLLTASVLLAVDAVLQRLIFLGGVLPYIGGGSLD